MNANFMEYVTGVAFSLQLSKRMCEAMQWVMADKYSPTEIGSFRIFMYPPQLGAMQALERRGLVTHKPIPDMQDNEYATRTERSRWVATPEGEKVFELLIMANICDATSVKRNAA